MFAGHLHPLLALNVTFALGEAPSPLVVYEGDVVADVVAAFAGALPVLSSL